ncbi:ParB N-terminal domain-containing protein [Sinorhizobium meliloti]|uniref:ParB N-terminal domain-containing protein n=1 Tax=Rhizobium meliloti TaxID=382 RepID=UPI000FD932D9|nr:ParB N-terminal domain-containing protein [Sinorhizobium meliloti]RVG79119.1 chromosome partitioning protein ParB [Sinorhizobium meliloti]RVI35192.1 chromosome partitioning protein ParB [Sinorhizobium meliloti]RVJ20097.1 chromosome partitioning protein ParB [Sinorhizobium meliloti]RVK00703.1 chromosome partitioning protein ParB [Sinorhizobium meliloti]RVP34634.1 chromosome partitioning protein ParB [Sinorhizobium meliloti]
MTDIITVALSKLDADPRNVRKTYSAEGIEALAANIRADGYRLLQNLVVRKGAKKGRYFVVAGGRRLAALNLLAEAGEIAKDYPVECKEREGEIATEISLAENVMREEMHPVDQYEAFDALTKQGKEIADIAARFGTTETIVRKRLALARVSPILLQQFRDEDMSFAQLSAFTVSDDHERQVTVWNSLPSWNRDPHSIRRALTEEMIPATDKRVQFIGGLAAYEEAGGPVKRDLFDDRNAGYAVDAALVESLVAEKLEATAATLRAEGWKWVECSATAPGGYHAMKRHYPEAIPLSEDDQAALDAAEAKYDELAELIESGTADDEAEAKLADVEQRIDALNARTEAYSPEALAQAGTFVFLDYYGRLAIERGFVKPEAVDEAEDEDGEGLPSARGAAKPKAPSISHSAALTEDLTAHKTAALRIELANNPDVALVAVVHAMLLSVAYPYNSERSALQLSLTHERLEPSMKDAESCKGLSAFNDLAENYGHHLPGKPAELFDWLLEQPQGMVLSLLAFGAAHSINAVEKKFTDRNWGIEQANQLGRALKVNMPDWFETTGDSYFKHVNRTTIELAVRDAKGSEAELSVRAAAKKSEAVTIADRLVAGTGWIPAPVRIAPAEPKQELGAESIAEDEQFPQAAE